MKYDVGGVTATMPSDPPCLMPTLAFLQQQGNHLIGM